MPLEIQAQNKEGIAKRVCEYNNHASDYHGCPVASFVIFADPDPQWYPCEYGYTIWGTTSNTKYSYIKILDFAGKEAELQASDSPSVWQLWHNSNTARQI